MPRLRKGRPYLQNSVEQNLRRCIAKMEEELAGLNEGNLVLDGHDDDGSPLVRTVDLFTAADTERYMPHWATCPNAEEFRSS